MSVNQIVALSAAGFSLAMALVALGFAVSALRRLDRAHKRAHNYSPAIGKSELHHTMGGDVLRIGEPKARKSRALLDRVRDFFLAW